MAHPYAEHRQTAKEHSRVKHITKGYASGGAVNRTEDDSKVRKMSASQEREVNPEGGVAPHRADRPKRAKGGKVGKHHGSGKTIVNVITGGHPPGVVPPMPGPPAGIAPAAMAPPPMAAKPPMMPPPGASGPPPGGPPMPMRARGGKVRREDGGKVNDWSGSFGPSEGGAKSGTQTSSTESGPDKDGYMTHSGFISGKRAKGGAVKSIGMKVGTKVSHTTGKSDLPDMNRKRVVTFNTGGGVKTFMAGGRVESPDGVAKATKLPGGGGGGKARLAKAHRAERR